MDLEYKSDFGDFRGDIIKEIKANIEKNMKSAISDEHGGRPKVKWKEPKKSENLTLI